MTTNSQYIRGRSAAEPKQLAPSNAIKEFATVQAITVAILPPNSSGLLFSINGFTSPRLTEASNLSLTPTVSLAISESVTVHK